MQCKLWVLLSVICCALPSSIVADQKALQRERDLAAESYSSGNYKEAFEKYQRLTLDLEEDSATLAEQLSQALRCLNSLGNLNDFDRYIEAVVAKHSDSWRVLVRAAEEYGQVRHQGFIVAGKFYRGGHRGGGRYVDAQARDRVRALQLLVQADLNSQAEARKSDLVSLYRQFAYVLSYSNNVYQSWKLQSLADLSVLPDYDEYHYEYYRGGGTAPGIPVDESGSPIYYAVPDTFEHAKNDGERFRWALEKQISMDLGSTDRIKYEWAQFLRAQFDVQTIATFGFGFGDDSERKDESGTYALHTLREDETIAKLATGIKRFALPKEYNFINILLSLADRADQKSASSYAEEADDLLAQIFEDRRQYVKAADRWKITIDHRGTGSGNNRQLRLDQIVGAWGKFENLSPQPSETKPALEYIYRNGESVQLEAFEIDLDRLLNDVKAYLKSNPGQPEYEKLEVSNIGYRLIEKSERQYIGKKAASWVEKLEPSLQHFDKRITFHAPLKKAGAYLVTAQIAGGNKSNIVLWLNDTVILRKQLADGNYYFVADAESGKPLAEAQVSFFGYKRVERKTPGLLDKVFRNLYDTVTTEFTSRTDELGQVLPSKETLSAEYQWLVVARSKDGRVGHLGFSSFWYQRPYDYEYNQQKIFVITDRPVYRPGQTVKFKFWVRHAKYDQDDNSSSASSTFTVESKNPKNEKIFEKQFATDSYGGFEGEISLAKDAALGIYNLFIPNIGSGGTFRVEEYKKPEFEVSIDAPQTPVMLGDKVEAKIKAKYYFGAPVTEAKVKYKVLRYNHTANWYPGGVWDWFYGVGYWWFAYDYPWYPGWHIWGCHRPIPWWWTSPTVPPEVVLENEAQVNSDGEVKFEIDSALAKALHSDFDQRYEITAEVTDRSRRTITAQGQVLVARKPFKVYAWVDRGHYQSGDAIRADFSAQTLDQKPVSGKGTLKLFRVSYKSGVAEERMLEEWPLDPDTQGRATMQMKAAEAGQYRLAYSVRDSADHVVEGGYLFVVRGEGFKGESVRFNDIEIIPDKREYKPGDKVRLMVNTNRQDSTVLLFVRPSNGVYLAPEVISLDGKSSVREIEITRKDMPNIFIEALTISASKVFSEVREIVVPPEDRVINVELAPSAEKFKPGEMANLKVKLTDLAGKPFVGSTVIAVYDKALEYISGGSNVPEIKAFFWKWRRQHNAHLDSSLARLVSANMALPMALQMQALGVFGYSVADELSESQTRISSDSFRKKGAASRVQNALGGAQRFENVASDFDSLSIEGAMAPASAPMEEKDRFSEDAGAGGVAATGDQAQPMIRKEFADTAFWAGALSTDKEGLAQVSFKMPENLSEWKIRSWAIGRGTRVGQAETSVVTTKNLLVRLQAPRFFIEKDEVVISANIHNYLESKKSVQAKLELGNDSLQLIDSQDKTIEIESNGEARIDWRVKVVKEGEATIRVFGLSDQESDAMEQRFPVYVHGMLKTDSFSGSIRPEDNHASLTIKVPAARRVEQSRLEIRYSPSLASAMVDALPYLVSYPYGCTEQTLNRFLPTVITQKILLDMKLDLQAIAKKRTNLNAQELGDDTQRAAQWKRFDQNPVFDPIEVKVMTAAGLERLLAMQLSDGGWGWFSGWGEFSSPHTTAYVVHGLQVAKEIGLSFPEAALSRGVAWLENYQASQIRELENAPSRTDPYKMKADDIDAFVYMVLVDAGSKNQAMMNFLYRDKNELAVYTKAMFGIALEKQGIKDKLEAVLQNIRQFVIEDDENQTAYLKLPESNYWWNWYGSEYEAHSYYLKLLARTDPRGALAPKLVKYLLNNRKHATYWNSTRDTAVTIEAFADYLKASGEDKPNMTVEIFIDGKRFKEVSISSENLFTFDNKALLEGEALSSGEHTIEFKKKGTGPLYFNAYLSNFTLEDFIGKAGLEIKVERKFYKLRRVEAAALVQGARGQALAQKIEKFEREPIAPDTTLKSGDMVEIELEIDSKNDYEYLLFEDMKAAGFEPLEVRSGYNGNDLGAYVEYHDERVAFFARTVARGKHSVSYRLRAEIPGKFSALPTRASAMYAPELRANSDEFKLGISD